MTVPEEAVPEALEGRRPEALEGWRDDYSTLIMKSAALPSRELVRGEGCYVWAQIW